MCGFGGELRLDGAPADLAAVERMLPALASRGPDGEGRWQHGPVALVHRRLRIIDLSDAGAQPMIDPELGLALVFNGCIYNYRELRDELTAAGYAFRSTSDTEVILKAYHRWGTACVERFYGMFAFALVELATNTVVLARDRLGIKPLYLAEGPGRVRFASTLPALLAAGDVDTGLDPVALHHYLTFHSVVPPPRTILAGVRKLPPATVRLITADGRSTDTTYWRPEFNRAAAPAMSADEWQERLMAALRTAVRRRMVADVPVGVLLSGGLDSSLIVALLAEQGQTGLATFSIGFEAAAGESGDEFHYSDLVARHFDTDHQQIRIGAQRFVPAVHQAIAAMSEPMVSHDCVAFHLLSEEVSQRITVVQSGQGADEILAGYDWYPPMANVARADAVEAYARVFFDRRHDALGGHLAPEWMLDHDASLEFVAAHFGAPGADTALDAALRLDSLVMLVDDPVKRVDNMTMAWGLEARVPFLDHEVVELAAACPPAMKLAQGGKGVLKAASRGIVPDEVIDRPKGYFPVPAIRHLAGPLLDDVRDALTAQPARERGLFRKDYLEELLDAPNARRTTLGSNALWQLGLLELWLQRIGV
ncbi:N-acetylglutaminylglutamine amidotransferase [Micromonospora sp. NBRC 107095]|uniref:N-acetylglutaminylglutamine amidotransferase n=1 Tax=Micromonospora sp. NBRC 107095 TaxID=3032209 RepID=UPI0024A47005|nr:N-acetylglutaminylglutamine amidotransferase [Micromonospora sp. NBRC 107095]GLZ61410.1 asparagine synthetase B [Micromonospora sp. NBRC 107095]